MAVYKSRSFAKRRYEYGGSGIVDMIGSFLARYATKPVLATSAKTAIRGTLGAAKRAVPHLIAHKVASTIAVSKKQKRLDIDAKHSPGKYAAVADHCNLTNMQVWLNHSRYPSVDMAIDFAKEQYAGVYKSFCDFVNRCYGTDTLLTGSAVNPSIQITLFNSRI